MPNGINFDYSNENEFKAYVVQQLGKLDVLPDIKAKADKVPILETELNALRKEYDNSERWNNIKSASGPVMVALHIVAHKLGINI